MTNKIEHDPNNPGHSSDCMSQHRHEYSYPGDGCTCKTNKTERYFVVSESELKELVTVATINGYCVTDESKDVLIAEAACRAREVPEWATHFTQYEPESSLLVRQAEEIKR
jgi:hypothetical protein